MKKEEVYGHIDHTLLKAFSTTEQIEAIAEEALKYGTASICIPASFVNYIHNKYKDVNICTVIGFPLGYSATSIKVAEAKQAIEDGANEIDMVINIGWAKEHKFDAVTEEIKAVKAACRDKILKVIIETCYLTDEEKIALCKCVSDAKADYIKTSTGFGTGGATLEDVKLLKANVAPYDLCACRYLYRHHRNPADFLCKQHYHGFFPEEYLNDIPASYGRADCICNSGMVQSDAWCIHKPVHPFHDVQCIDCSGCPEQDAGCCAGCYAHNRNGYCAEQQAYQRFL